MSSSRSSCVLITLIRILVLILMLVLVLILVLVLVLLSVDLQGWSPEPSAYQDLPQRSPEGLGPSLYLQTDLLREYNITGGWSQEAESGGGVRRRSREAESGGGVRRRSQEAEQGGGVRRRSREAEPGGGAGLTCGRVLTQGGGGFGAFVSSFYLQFSRDGRRWSTSREPGAAPRAQVFLGNHDDRGVAEVRLDRAASARFVRLLPHDFQNAVYLRMEVMGCDDGSRCPAGHFSCPPPGGCIEAALRCDGTAHCPEGEDETGCTESTTQPDR
ncbi:SCO-spondin [Liparis tanakae]|uniref:SCO-spondin n=1 Tax=Liparis tanakae TaxID=230148 RepID=A0A4Z2E6N2_9TELE|nr:SCO-spondin [Liparis tanakae]